MLICLSSRMGRTVPKSLELLSRGLGKEREIRGLIANKEIDNKFQTIFI